VVLTTSHHSFPMSVTGEIQEFEIRPAMMAELGLKLVRTA
jgi:hypothetical protein